MKSVHCSVLSKASELPERRNSILSQSERAPKHETIKNHRHFLIHKYEHGLLFLIGPVMNSASLFDFGYPTPHSWWWRRGWRWWWGWFLCHLIECSDRKIIGSYYKYCSLRKMTHWEKNKFTINRGDFEYRITVS